MQNMKRLTLLTILIAASFNIAGCSYDLGPSGVGCPPLPAYSSAEQKEAAAEIRKNPNGQLAKLVRDYGKVRKACRI